ncbi:hypothetical protein [Fundidesulfovibrio soli]|uniref:hypothetical protein n=1 Tax=Fundidesulfovibrio soli TaxID=2922716 RepID=UPI001FB03244|nr:hypothetical protein [Fundidesulfovibrio soli]
MDILPSPLQNQAALEDFFSRMFQDILAGRVTLESVLLVGGFFGAFFLLAALSIVFGKKPTGFLPKHPVTWLTTPSRISQLLDAAVSQRSKVRVSFHHQDKPTRSTDGVLLEAGPRTLKLELSSVRNANQAWVGRTLELAFRLRLPEQPEVQSTFGFMSGIEHVSKDADGVVRLTISRPQRLELNQNRQHLRVEVPDKYVRSLQLWTEDEVRRRGDPNDPDTWGDPSFSLDHDGSQDLLLENLSGGGARVQLTPETLHRRHLPIRLGQQYFMRITLADVDFGGHRTHYLLSRLVKCYDDCASRLDLSLGLGFVAQGAPVQAPLTGLNWTLVNRDFGVPVIDDWVFGLHLELYRNKGIA